MLPPFNRRALLTHAGRLGLAAGFAWTERGWWWPAPVAAAQPPPRESVRVLMGDVTHEQAQLVAAASATARAGWWESALVETPFPFTHLAVHWVGGALHGLQVRTSPDGREWSTWQRVTVESRPADNPRGEWFAALVGADRSSLAQYRLPADGPLPTRLTLTYLNSMDGPRQPLGPAPAPRPVLKGRDLRTEIVTREEWGADESLRFTPTGEEVWERAYVAPRLIAVHHTATRNFPEDPAADVRAVYALHAVTQGWGDIGYQALIDADGRIYEGRRGREVDPYGRLDRDILSYGVVAGHATGFNYGSASVALLGNFQELPPTDQAWQALEEVLVFQHRRYEIDPRETIDFARSNDQWRYNVPTLPGHRDCTPTECPGDFVYARLPDLRDRVAERINGGAPSIPTLVRPVSLHNVWPGELLVRWQGAAPYNLVAEGFWRHPGEDPVDYRTGYDADGMPLRWVTSETQTRLALSEPGQYTVHVRRENQAFAERWTVLAERQVVADNGDPVGITRSAGWTRSRSIMEFYGSDYELAEVGSGASFTWELVPPEDGTYQVQACWAAGPDRSRAATYTMARDGEELATVTRDQSQGSDQWNTLGVFGFQAGQICAVTLTAPEEEGDHIVVADAVRLLVAS